jgi:Fe-S cluster biogenesis protein NfuA
MSPKNSQENNPLFNEVSNLIEQIRPSIQADGGDIELVDVTKKGVVSIRFLGACIGCPSLDVTLQGGIEATLKERIKGITLVKAIE